LKPIKRKIDIAKSLFGSGKNGNGIYNNSKFTSMTWSSWNESQNFLTCSIDDEKHEKGQEILFKPISINADAYIQSIAKANPKFYKYFARATIMGVFHPLF